MLDWFFAATVGFCDVALGMAGAVDVSVRELGRASEGARAGVPISSLTLEMAWRRPWRA